MRDVVPHYAIDSDTAGKLQYVPAGVETPMPVGDPWIDHAIRNIYGDYGDRVSVVQKNKNLLKFGRNSAVGTATTGYTVMTLPSGVAHETYVNDNLITTLSSSSNSDTQLLRVEGHTLSGGNFTFVVQNITLTGQTQVSLTTPLARCTRIANLGSTNLVGTVYAYEDDTSTAGVPDTSSLVHTMIPAGEQQTEKASTTISSVDYWIITGFDAKCYEKTSAYAEVVLEVRSYGGVFLPKETISVASGENTHHDFKPYLVVPSNSDVRLRAVASGAGVDVGGSIEGVLAIVVSQ